EAEADRGVPEAADIGVALAAEIDQAAMEGGVERKAGEDEARRVLERVVTDGPRPESALDVQPGGLERALADEGHDETGNEEGDDEINQRNQAVVGPGGKLGVGGAHSAASFGNSRSGPRASFFCDAELCAYVSQVGSYSSLAWFPQ